MDRMLSPLLLGGAEMTRTWSATDCPDREYVKAMQERDDDARFRIYQEAIEGGEKEGDICEALNAQWYKCPSSAVRRCRLTSG